MPRDFDPEVTTIEIWVLKADERYLQMMAKKARIGLPKLLRMMVRQLINTTKRNERRDKRKSRKS